MSQDQREYTVVGVTHAGRPGEAGGEAPPEVLERFEGRTFSLAELEQRGVRIAGGRAYYTAGGRDWLLEIFPEPGTAD